MEECLLHGLGFLLCLRAVEPGFGVRIPALGAQSRFAGCMLASSLGGRWHTKWGCERKTMKRSGRVLARGAAQHRGTRLGADARPAHTSPQHQHARPTSNFADLLNKHLLSWNITGNPMGTQTGGGSSSGGHGGGSSPTKTKPDQRREQQRPPRGRKQQPREALCTRAPRPVTSSTATQGNRSSQDGGPGGARQTQSEPHSSNHNLPQQNDGRGASTWCS